MADRTYSVTGDNQTVVAAPQLVFLNPSAGGAGVPGFEVLRAWVGQRANATSAQQGVRLGTKVTAFPTLVSATPAKVGGLGLPTANLAGGTTGAAGTAGINSSVNGGGTEIGTYTDNFNVLNGWLFVATPAETMLFMPGGTSGFFHQFTSTPGTLTGWSFGVLYREVG
jgi:hypothetical protein